MKTSVRREMARDPMTPVPFHVVRAKKELADVFTIELTPFNGDARPGFLPGQFNMLYHFGTGEVPISISGDPTCGKTMVHTIRNVGAVTNALSCLREGDVIGVRGPFGSAWPSARAEGDDIVIIGGGIGLAPLRPLILHVLRSRDKYGRLVILYGARTPADILFLGELKQWRARLDASVEVTVDRATFDWAGKVGSVIKLIPKADFDPLNASVFICGPEIMMRFAIPALLELGVPDESIHLSLERNMKCAVGVCGHCQFGGYFACKDGPVFSYGSIEKLFAIREL